MLPHFLFFLSMGSVHDFRNKIRGLALAFGLRLIAIHWYALELKTLPHEATIFLDVGNGVFFQLSLAFEGLVWRHLLGRLLLGQKLYATTLACPGFKGLHHLAAQKVRHRHEEQS